MLDPSKFKFVIEGTQHRDGAVDVSFDANNPSRAERIKELLTELGFEKIHVSTFPAHIYDRDKPIENTRWSGTMPLPSKGDRVFVRINTLGPGTIRGFFMEHGYLGVYVNLENPPETYLRQNGGANIPTMVFGSEIQPIPAAKPAKHCGCSEPCLCTSAEIPSE